MRGLASNRSQEKGMSATDMGKQGGMAKRRRASAFPQISRDFLDVTHCGPRDIGVDLRDGTRRICSL
jgi:hypothetical protein